MLQNYPDLGIPANAQQELPNILTLWFKPSDAAFRG